MRSLVCLFLLLLFVWILPGTVLATRHPTGNSTLENYNSVAHIRPYMMKDGAFRLFLEKNKHKSPLSRKIRLHHKHRSMARRKLNPHVHAHKHVWIPPWRVSARRHPPGKSTLKHFNSAAHIRPYMVRADHRRKHAKKVEASRVTPVLTTASQTKSHVTTSTISPHVTTSFTVSSHSKNIKTTNRSKHKLTSTNRSKLNHRAQSKKHIRHQPGNSTLVHFNSAAHIRPYMVKDDSLGKNNNKTQASRTSPVLATASQTKSHVTFSSTIPPRSRKIQTFYRHHHKHKLKDRWKLHPHVHSSKHKVQPKTSAEIHALSIRINMPQKDKCTDCLNSTQASLNATQTVTRGTTAPHKNSTVAKGTTIGIQHKPGNGTKKPTVRPVTARPTTISTKRTFPTPGFPRILPRHKRSIFGGSKPATTTRPNGTDRQLLLTVLNTLQDIRVQMDDLNFAMKQANVQSSPSTTFPPYTTGRPIPGEYRGFSPVMQQPPYRQPMGHRRARSALNRSVRRADSADHVRNHHPDTAEWPLRRARSAYNRSVRRADSADNVRNPHPEIPERSEMDLRNAKDKANTTERVLIRVTRSPRIGLNQLDDGKRSFQSYVDERETGVKHGPGKGHVSGPIKNNQQSRSDMETTPMMQGSGQGHVPGTNRNQQQSPAPSMIVHGPTSPGQSANTAPAAQNIQLGRKPVPRTFLTKSMSQRENDKFKTELIRKLVKQLADKRKAGRYAGRDERVLLPIIRRTIHSLNLLNRVIKGSLNRLTNEETAHFNMASSDIRANGDNLDKLRKEILEKIDGVQYKISLLISSQKEMRRVLNNTFTNLIHSFEGIIVAIRRNASPKVTPSTPVQKISTSAHPVTHLVTHPTGKPPKKGTRLRRKLTEHRRFMKRRRFTKRGRRGMRNPLAYPHKIADTFSPTNRHKRNNNSTIPETYRGLRGIYRPLMASASPNNLESILETPHPTHNAVVTRLPCITNSSTVHHATSVGQTKSTVNKKLKATATTVVKGTRTTARNVTAVPKHTTANHKPAAVTKKHAMGRSLVSRNPLRQFARTNNVKVQLRWISPHGVRKFSGLRDRSKRNDLQQRFHGYPDRSHHSHKAGQLHSSVEN